MPALTYSRPTLATGRRPFVTYYVTSFRNRPRGSLRRFVTYYVTYRLILRGAIVLGLVTYYVTSLPAAQATVPWTLQQAVDAALENNPDARIAQHRIAGARALEQQARAMLMPQVSLSAGYSQTNSPMMAFGSILNQRAFDFSLDFNHPGTIDNLNATGTVALNLYSGGRTSAGRRAARAGVAATEYDEGATHNQLIAITVASYLNIIKAREAVDAVEAGVRAYEAAVANAQARHEAGQMLKADLLSLEVQLAQTRENLMTARHGRALAERSFLFVLGIELDSEPVELLADDPAIAALRPPDSLDYSRRPELLGLQERAHAAAAMVRVARGGRQPEVNAFGSVQHDRGWETNNSGNSWMAGVAVKLNIFDGGSTAGKINQAEAELEEVHEMLRKTELGVGLEVEQARLTHESALERLAVATTAVAQAEESAALSRARFQAGALLTADLIGVEGRLIEARMRRAVAAADERIAVANLRRAVGLEPLAPTPSANVPSS